MSEDVAPELISEVGYLRTEVQRLRVLAAEALGAKILAEHDLKIEREHSDRWQKLAGTYDDIRYALRNASDDPAGHAEFYNEAAHLIFGDQ